MNIKNKYSNVKLNINKKIKYIKRKVGIRLNKFDS